MLGNRPSGREGGTWHAWWGAADRPRLHPTAPERCRLGGYAVLARMLALVLPLGLPMRYRASWRSFTLAAKNRAPDCTHGSSASSGIVIVVVWMSFGHAARNEIDASALVLSTRARENPYLSSGLIVCLPILSDCVARAQTQTRHGA